MSTIRLFFKTWAISASLMLLTWMLFLVTKNPSVADLGWVASITIIGIFTFMQMKQAHWAHGVLLELLLIWAVRLGGFLFYTRLLPGHLDDRYSAISRSFSHYEAVNFLINYQIQALLVAFFFFAFRAAFNAKKIPVFWIIISVALCLAGLLGEAITDYQLFEFKESGASGICQKGLWYYSRHPNYFFELVFWIGFSIVGLRSYKFFYACATPLALWATMVYITIPLTERVALQKRPKAYKAYIERTNRLLPVPQGLLKDLLPLP